MMGLRSLWNRISGRAAREADVRFRAVLSAPSPLIAASTSEVMEAADRLCAEVRHDAHVASTVRTRPLMRSYTDQEADPVPGT